MHLIELHLACAPRQRVVAPDDQRDIVGLLIDQAEAQLAATLRSAESHDSKALGLLAVEAGAALALITFHAGLNRFWPALLVGAWLSAMGFGTTLRSHDFNVGPAVDTLYEEYIGRSSLEAGTRILDALTQSIADAQTIVVSKRRGWMIGTVMMLVTLAAAAVCLPVIH